MGVVQSQCRNVRHFLSGHLPEAQRHQHFIHKSGLDGRVEELLCCPSTGGCRVLEFDQSHSYGGEARYKAILRLSHSEHVPRYQIHVVKDGATRQWVVGHLEKTETHLRAKPGEFIRVQVWKLTCNAMKMELRRSAMQQKSHLCMSAVRPRPTPSATDMIMMGMTIATQAKQDKDTKTGKYVAESERWVETIGVSKNSYKLTVRSQKKGRRDVTDLDQMNIEVRGKKQCIARKQLFPSVFRKLEQPHLEVQIRVNDSSKVDAEEDEHAFRDSLLDTNGLMSLLLSLAWSEDTMCQTQDMTVHFIQAMRAASIDPGASAALGLSISWDTADLKEKLKHIEYAQIFDWETEDIQDASEEDPV